MPVKPTLLYLHGVGGGDPEDAWRVSLDAALMSIDCPSLDDVDVVSPKYSFGLRGVDDDFPLPKITVRSLRGDEAARHRRDYERRRTAMEVLLGSDDDGTDRRTPDLVIPRVAALPQFVQARNYLNNSKIRAWVLQRVLDKVEAPDRLVIVGHSLGSVIAADVLRRLPPTVQVVGMVTIGSPLAYEKFHVDRLPSVLESPPANLSWWVNFWNAADPVTAHRGVSSVIPWVLDQRTAQWTAKGHGADTYLSDQRVVTAIARGLFGSKSRELVLVPHRNEMELDFAETITLLGLRLAHLTLSELDDETRARYVDGLRHVQAQTVEQVRVRNAAERRPVPSSIAELAVDLSDPESASPAPTTPDQLSMSDAVLALVALATTNLLRPFEINVPKAKRQKALEQLTLEMGFGTALGERVIASVDEARDAVDAPTNWVRWIAVGVGLTALVVATGGLMLASAPGLAGAAALTSALAAFGPGGMIGGLLTAGVLVTAGGGSIAVGLAGVGTSAATVEAVVTTQLAAAILRRKQNLEQDPQIWAAFTELEMEIAKELTRLQAVSDSSAPTLKELHRKLDTIQRALRYMQKEKLSPAPLELLEADD
jgi:pimeloyl-ACP methyl ester carboxylesterase